MSQTRGMIQRKPTREIVGPEKDRLVCEEPKKRNLLGRSVFGDGLGTFRDSVFSQFSRQQETNSSLDLPRSDGRSLVVLSQSRSFGSNSFEDIVDETVHDGHGLSTDSSIRMNLFQNFVDVHSITFLPFLLPLLVPLDNILLGFPSLLRSFSSSFWRHDE